MTSEYGKGRKKSECLNCGQGDSARAMAFKGLDYCSDACRKALGIKAFGEDQGVNVIGALLLNQKGNHVATVPNEALNLRRESSGDWVDWEGGHYLVEKVQGGRLVARLVKRGR